MNIPHLQAISAVAMYDGFLQIPHTLDSWQAKSGGGMIELYNRLADYAAVSAEIYAACWQAKVGVYPYEVDEPLGMWFANQILTMPENGTGELPTDAQVNHELGRLAYEFFQHDELSLARIYTLTGFRP